MLRRIFAPRIAKIMGSWRKLHNQELYNLYSLPNIRITKSGMRYMGMYQAREERCIENSGRKG
jgi:hypothetical protein